MIILALCIKIQVDNLFKNRETIKTVERVESAYNNLLYSTLLPKIKP